MFSSATAFVRNLWSNPVGAVKTLFKPGTKNSPHPTVQEQSPAARHVDEVIVQPVPTPMAPKVGTDTYVQPVVAAVTPSPIEAGITDKLLLSLLSSTEMRLVIGEHDYNQDLPSLSEIRTMQRGTKIEHCCSWGFRNANLGANYLIREFFIKFPDGKIKINDVELGNQEWDRFYALLNADPRVVALLTQY